MKITSRNDIGPRVVAVGWANGDCYYGKGARVRVVARAWFARFIYGRRS